MGYQVAQPENTLLHEKHSFSPKGDSIAATKIVSYSAAISTLPPKKRYRNFDLLNAVPIEIPFEGVEPMQFVEGDEYAMEAKGFTAMKTQWTFSVVKTLPPKKRFINIGALGAISAEVLPLEKPSNAVYAEENGIGPNGITAMKTDCQWATLPPKKRFRNIDLFEATSIRSVNKRVRCSDSLAAAIAEPQIAKKPRLDAAALTRNQDKENIVPNTPTMTRSQAKPIENGKRSRRSMMFKSSRPIYKLNVEPQINTLSKWTTSRTLDALSETDLDSSSRQQIHRCLICDASFKYHASSMAHLESHI